MNPPTRRRFSIRIFLPDGTPDGLRAVEKSNWIGRGVVCPRPRLWDTKARLVSLTKSANRSVLDNGNDPQVPSHSEANREDVESLLDEKLLTFPAGADVPTNANRQFCSPILLTLADDRPRAASYARLTPHHCF